MVLNNTPTGFSITPLGMLAHLTSRGTEQTRVIEPVPPPARAADLLSRARANRR